MRSRIFGAFVVKFLACLLLLGWYNTRTLSSLSSTFGDVCSGYIFGDLNSVANPLVHLPVYFFGESPFQERRVGDFED